MTVSFPGPWLSEFNDDFEDGTATEYTAVNVAGTTVPTVVNSKGVGGSKALQLHNASGTGHGYVRRSFAPAREVVVRGWLNFPAYGSGMPLLMGVWGDGGAVEHIRLEAVGIYTGAGSITIRRGDGTALATSGANVFPVWPNEPPAAPSYWEMKVILDDVNGLVQVRKDGVTVLSYRGDTRNGGANGTLDAAGWGSHDNGPNSTWWDALEVARLDTSTFLGLILSKAPAWHLPLDETTGATQAADASGADRNFTHGSNTASGGMGATRPFSGMDSGTAYDFRTINDALSRATDAEMQTQAFTFLAAVHMDSNGGYKAVGGKDSSTTRGWTLYIQNGILRLDSAASPAPFQGVTNNPTGVPRWVGVSYNPVTEKIRLWRDGVQDAENTVTNWPGNQQAFPFVVGASYAGTTSLNFSFDGRIDGATFYPYELTAAEHAAIFAKVSPPVSTTIPLGVAVETDTALPLTRVLGTRTIPLGVAVEADTALPLAVSNATRVSLGVATEGDVALPLTRVLGPRAVPLGIAVETDTALPIEAVYDTPEPAEPEALNENVGQETYPVETTPPLYPAPTGSVSWATFSWLAGDEPPEEQRFIVTPSDAQVKVYEIDPDTGFETEVYSGGSDFRISPQPSHEYVIVVGTDEPVENITVRWLDATPADGSDPAAPIETVGPYSYGEIELTNSDPPEGWVRVLANETNDRTISFTSDNDEPFTVTVYDSEGSEIASSTGTGTVSVTWPGVAGQAYDVKVSAPSDLVTFEFDQFVAPKRVDPGEPYSFVRVEVYEVDYATNQESLLTELPRRAGLTCQENLNSPGVGEVTLWRDDPIYQAYGNAGPGYVFRFGNIVKFWIGEKCIHAFRIARRVTKLISTEEYRGVAVTASGPSVHYMFEDIVVHHDRAPRPDSSDKRFFGWAAMRGEWYREEDWDNPITYNTRWDPPGRENRPPKERPKYDQPRRWPDKFAMWLWRPASKIRDPNGKKYYRRDFSIGRSGTHVRLYVTADESYKVYLDGEEVLSADHKETGYTEMGRRSFILDKGKHTIAALSKTSGQKSGGDGNDSIAITLMRVNEKGKPTTIVVNSGSDWEAWYGEDVPCWNRALVLKGLILEARKRGVNAAHLLKIGFTATEDSAGIPWKDRWNEEIDVGASLLAVQDMLSEGNKFDVWVDPEDYTVYAWRHRGEDVSASVTLEGGRNLLDYTVEEVDESKTDFLIGYDGGWTTWQAKARRKNFGVREVYLSLGNSKDDKDARGVTRDLAGNLSSARTRAGTEGFSRKPYRAVDGGFVAREGAMPFVDFNVGDTIKSPNRHNVLQPHRIMSLTLNESPDGLTFDPELDEAR